MYTALVRVHARAVRRCITSIANMLRRELCMLQAATLHQAGVVPGLLQGILVKLLGMPLGMPRGMVRLAALVLLLGMIEMLLDGMALLEMVLAGMVLHPSGAVTPLLRLGAALGGR